MNNYNHNEHQSSSSMANSSEIENLKAQINQEEQLKQAVENSYLELLSTSKELEKRISLIDEEIRMLEHPGEPKNDKKKKQILNIYEGNEWKTRFENQEEINRQLAKQISLFEKKLDEIKVRSKNIKNKIYLENNNEASVETINELERTRDSLLGQIKDYGWRIEQENKAYHKANDERKQLHQEILDTRNQFAQAKNDKTIGGGGQLTGRKSNIPSSQTNDSLNRLSNQSLHYLPSINSSYDTNLDASPSRRYDYNMNSPMNIRGSINKDLNNRLSVSKLNI